MSSVLRFGGYGPGAGTPVRLPMLLVAWFCKLKYRCRINKNSDPIDRGITSHALDASTTGYIERGMYYIPLS
jgi:hypothetical protein